jgi:hypothetical protein
LSEARRSGDELAQIAVAIQILGQHHQGERRFAGIAWLDAELGAQQQIRPLPGCHMGAHDARQGTFVGDGQGTVAQRLGALHQLLRAAGPPQKGEIGDAAQLGVRGKKVLHRASGVVPMQKPGGFIAGQAG